MGFGIILYYVLAANLISGAIFPDFSKIESACPSKCISSRCAAESKTSTSEAKSSVKASLRTAPVSSQSDNTNRGIEDSPCNPEDECLYPSASYLAKNGGSIAEWIKTFDFSQFSKLLVWAFLAGFAEQLVPDTLDSLIKRQTAAPAQTGTKASGN